MDLDVQLVSTVPDRAAVLGWLTDNLHFQDWVHAVLQDEIALEIVHVLQ